MATLNDVIKGIVFFLALVIPSAFFGERLIFAAADVRKQLGFFLLLFLIWMVIAQVRPAFSIAHPLVVLLAFAIMAMAALVLSMIMSRFNRFMKEYQSKEAHVHETDISRASASLCGLHVGHFQYAAQKNADRADAPYPRFAHFHGVVLHILQRTGSFFGVFYGT